MTLHVTHTKWYHPNGVMVFTENMLSTMDEMGIDYREHEGWRTSPDRKHFGLITMTASNLSLRAFASLRKPSLSMALTIPGTMQYVVDLGNPDGKVYNIGEYVQQRLMSSAMKASNSYLTNTRSVANAIRMRKGTEGKEITIVPVPVDPVFSPGNIPRSGDTISFLTIGKLTKRREGLLRIPGLLRESLPGEKIEIATVGPWCENIDKLSVQCAVNGIAHKRYPAKPNRSLPEFYRSASCYLYISDFEGYSMTPKEALACGTPCLISHNAVHDEIYTGKPGVTFLDGPESVVRAVEMGHSPAYGDWARGDTWHDVTQQILEELGLY